jgi:hypothetical protein
MKWVYRFFVVLGVIFFFILLGVGYFVVADPLNLRPVIMSLYFSEQAPAVPVHETVPSATSTVSNESSAGTKLNTEQKAALQSVGISPAAVPAQFTPAQIECFIGVLGEERVNAIKAGDTPTPTEFYQAKNCI